jgi:hypothetical protein
MKLIELFKIPNGKGFNKKRLENSEPITSLFTHVRGSNASVTQLVDLGNPLHQEIITKVLFLDDCYNCKTLTYVMGLFEKMYDELHHDATESHNISPTAIINDDLCTQIMHLQIDFIPVLLDGVEEFTKNGLIKLTYKSGSKSHTVTVDTMRKKAKVVASVFSFLSILFIMETVGLFPIIDDWPWKYKDLIETAPMNSSILAFLKFVFKLPKFKPSSFYGCFSHMLLHFLRVNHEAKQKKPDIFEFMNTNNFKKKIMNWVRHHAIANYFGDFYSSVICVSTETPVVLTTNLKRGNKKGATEIAGKELKKNFVIHLDSSSSEDENSKKKSASLTPPSPSSNKEKEPSKMVFQMISSEASSDKNSRKRLLCDDCISLKNKNKSNPVNFAVVSIVGKGTGGETMEKTAHCHLHAKYHYDVALTDKKHELVCDFDAIFGTPKNDTPFTAFEEVEYVYLREPIFSNDIKELLRNNNSPTKTTNCAENKTMRFECPTDCDSGSNCDNKQLSFMRALGAAKNNRLARRLERKPTKSLKGDGLFALKTYAIGECISEYTGKALLLKKGEVLPDSNYIMHLKENVYLDAKEYGNLSRFVNHSCDPNATIEKIEDVSL